MNDFLGEVVIDLHNQPLDDEPEWFHLKPHQESNYPGGVRTQNGELLKSRYLLYLSLSINSTFNTTRQSHFPIDFL